MLVIRLNKVTSTQDFAEAISNMLFEDFLVIAEEQTKARGRLGRSWYSPKGGLWFTYVKKNFKTEEIQLSSLKVAVAVLDVLRKFVDAKIRWPNDIVVNDKKIAGILIEAKTYEEDIKLADLFIGAGIDILIKEFPSDLNATSLYLEIGKEVELNIDEVIGKIEEHLKLDNRKIIDIVNQYLSIKDREVTLKGENWEKRCKALFVDYMGRLVTECGIYEVEEIYRVEVSH
ncbi:biotin--[acetyl-CoA-carboxylase] ligase [Saccharolobus solfataricus]|nr:biotin--[acetyl-CoA-carboxylase] ligase [Saccharolobus solfataricus]AKA73995.1 biotin--[acetyl-CoA-carboxylase] ligase [Saccharolobus solfataricus]AKA76692.1 biotin--[acetyl-CoA-carboxylase] ligase [Saccharolobus solfataricus]AKA79386.1 biotin--[acetyl-CoA-carboxylase] ligase [Saccharolobus solfataricus]AZF68473.1 biotin--[acetyl-CoA-carboxylase] ligase [Saccharolobus solfataricus]AZF71093.1 biotin--[acetyl-CoA-carboxylase] ligase [Saccharolobus solfataricus]